MNKKIIFSLAGLVILILATLLGFYLVGQKQIFKPQAYEEDATPFGVALTPANFPDHTPQELEQAFVFAEEIGSHVVNIGQWKDYDTAIVNYLIQTAHTHNLKFMVGFSPTTLDQNRCRIDAPDDIPLDFSNPITRVAFKDKADEIVDLNPDGLALATEINLLALCQDPVDQAQLDHFISLYNETYTQIKQEHPTLPIFVTFQYDVLKQNDQWSLIDRFQADLVGFTSYPSGTAPDDYYSEIINRLGQRPIYFMEVGWPARNFSEEHAQKDFVERLPTLFGGLNLTYLSWALLHDVNSFEGSLDILNYMGFRYRNGVPKQAFDAAKNLIFTPISTPTPVPQKGDINYDGRVDFNDMVILLTRWIENLPPGRADLNGDNRVDHGDYQILIQLLGY